MDPERDEEAERAREGSRGRGQRERERRKEERTKEKDRKPMQMRDNTTRTATGKSIEGRHLGAIRIHCRRERSGLRNLYLEAVHGNVLAGPPRSLLEGAHESPLVDSACTRGVTR